MQKHGLFLLFISFTNDTSHKIKFSNSMVAGKGLRFSCECLYWLSLTYSWAHHFWFGGLDLSPAAECKVRAMLPWSGQRLTIASGSWVKFLTPTLIDQTPTLTPDDIPDAHWSTPSIPHFNGSLENSWDPFTPKWTFIGGFNTRYLLLVLRCHKRNSE